MTDYTERFRTLGIGQMQQVLAALCEVATDPWAGHAFKGRLDVILAQTVGRTWEQFFASKYDCEPSRTQTDPTIIRAAEGVTLEPGEYEQLASGARFSHARLGSVQWLPGVGFFWQVTIPVTAVRRVDQKPASEPVAPAASGERPIVVDTARAGLDPKACGELIADIDAAIGYGGPDEGVDIDARAAIRKLAAMLGVEVAGG